jgi:hypothetical protein
MEIRCDLTRYKNATCDLTVSLTDPRAILYVSTISIMPSEIIREDDSEAIELLKKRLSKFETVEGRLKGLSYQPRATDVIIATTPKVSLQTIRRRILMAVHMILLELCMYSRPERHGCSKYATSSDRVGTCPLTK